MADLVVLSAVDIRIERGESRDGDVVRQQVEFGDVPPCVSFRFELYKKEISVELFDRPLASHFAWGIYH